MGELVGRSGGRVVLENACLSLDDLAERPVRDTVAVGKAPPVAPVDELFVVRHRSAQLGDEAALADPRHADEGDELRLLLDTHAGERTEEQRALVVAPDERRSRLVTQPLDARESLYRLPHLDRLRLPLGRDRGVCPVHDRALGRSVRRGRHEDPVDGRCALNPGCGVHHVARDHPFTCAGLRAERDQRLTGRNAGAHVQVERFVRLVQRGDRLTRCERCPHGSLGVVLVRRRGAEDRHDGVADELLHGPAVALEVPAQRLVVAAQKRANVLRVGVLGARRRPDEVDEDGRDDLALLAGLAGA